MFTCPFTTDLNMVSWIFIGFICIRDVLYDMYKVVCVKFYCSLDYSLS